MVRILETVLVISILLYNLVFVVYSLSSVQLFVTPHTIACQAPCPWDFSGKNIEMACHFLSRGSS